MDILIYVGPAPSRADVLAFAAPLVSAVATRVTLVSGGNAERKALLDDAAARLQAPEGVAVSTLALPGDAHSAILSAASDHNYDLVIFGRLNQRMGRLLPYRRSKRIAQRLEPSVLRVQGEVRPIRRVLLAAGGNEQMLYNASIVGQVAGPLGAEVTVLHVRSQQSVVFRGMPNRQRGTAFLQSESQEARVIREGIERLRAYGVHARAKIRTGLVINEVIDEVREGQHDLLALGAHRIASALDRILLEDITGDLLEVSPVPTLVIKGSPTS